VRRVGRLALGLLAAAVVAAASIGAALALLGVDPLPSTDDGDAAAPTGAPALREDPERGEETSPTGAGDTGRRAGQGPVAPLAPGATASWAALEHSLPARVGLSVLPLAGGAPRDFGSLQSGHAWSTIKVPILVTLLRERDGQGLSAEEEGWASAALTASDNEAAAALFDQIEAAQGGLDGASRAVEATLRQGGDSSTAVATAPPPSGAVSTYGQTEWSLSASAKFFRTLANGCLLDRSDTEYVLGLMGEVVPEQRWGLGEASFDPSWQVGIKGGWGPEGSASGPYLVRQAGIVRDGGAGVAVAIAAQADSGSFEAGIEALDQISTWLQDNLHTLGPSGKGPC
jgi:hypothetical protein